MKYIVLEMTLPGPKGMKQKLPVIFPEEMVHAEVSRTLGHLLMRGDHGKNRTAEVKTISAGFVHFTGDVVCRGESESLGLKSAPGDSELLENFDYTRGFS